MFHAFTMSIIKKFNDWMLKTEDNFMLVFFIVVFITIEIIIIFFH